jgi:hypothetical protein
MAIFRKKQQSPANQTHKQIRELGGALQKTVKQLDRSYPSSEKSARIQQEFEHRLAAATRPHPLVAELRKCNAELDSLTNMPQSQITFRDHDRMLALYRRKYALEEKLGVVKPHPQFVKELTQCTAQIAVMNRTPQEWRSKEDHDQLDELYQRKAALEEAIRKSLRR